MTHTTTVRREIHFQGRVQGVGFRYRTARVAQRFDVAGFVQNLPDGRVLLVVEAAPDETDAFLAAVRQEMAGYIASANSTECSVTNEFADFQIRR